MIKLSSIFEDLAATAVMRKKEVPYQTYTPEEYGDPQEKIQAEEVEPGNFIPYVPAEESVEEGAEEDALKGTRTEIPVMEKQKQDKMNKEIKRLQEIAGIAQEEETRSETRATFKGRDMSPYWQNAKAHDRMDGLVHQEHLKTFIESGRAIINDLKQDGFDDEDIYDFLESHLKQF